MLPEAWPITRWSQHRMLLLCSMLQEMLTMKCNYQAFTWSCGTKNEECQDHRSGCAEYTAQTKSKHEYNVTATKFSPTVMPLTYIIPLSYEWKWSLDDQCPVQPDCRILRNGSTSNRASAVPTVVWWTVKPWQRICQWNLKPLAHEWLEHVSTEDQSRASLYWRSERSLHRSWSKWIVLSDGQHQQLILRIGWSKWIILLDGSTESCRTKGMDQ